MYDVVTCKSIKVDGPEFVRYDLEMESLFHVSHVTNVHFEKTLFLFMRLISKLGKKETERNE